MRLFLAAYVTDGPVDPNNLPRFVNCSDLKTYSYNAVAHRPMSQCSELEFLMMRNSALMHEVTMSGVPHPFVKTHNALTTIDGVELFPEQLTHASVYIVRDPRDVAVSFARFLDKDMDFTIDFMSNDGASLQKHEVHGKELFHYLGSWSGHVDSWMRTNFNGIAIRYEDLIKDPLSEFKQLCHFLGFPDDPERLKKAVQNTEFSKIKRHEELVGFKEMSDKGTSFFGSGKSGGWRDILSKEQEQRIIDAHGEVMRAVGYLDKKEEAA